MEFHEKLQAMRKQKGLTQEGLAEILYVSRTAVSKWESGRGYPNLESLKAISQFFGVSIDDLLSGREMPADPPPRPNTDPIWGLADCGAVLFFLLPLLGQGTAGAVRGVSLLGLTAIQPYLKAAYCLAAVGMMLWGILTLALQSLESPCWNRWKTIGSLGWNILLILLLILGRQPYGARLALAFLIIKAFISVKRG